MHPLDLFFPRQVKCMFCGSETKVFGVCDACYKSLPFIKDPACSKCGGSLNTLGSVCVECKNKNSYLDRCYAVFEYTKDIQAKVISFKQGGVKHIGETFAYCIQEKFNNIEEKINLIIPVPISNERRKVRGYNQSEILCNELMDTNKVRLDILVRPSDTPHQTGLDRKHRLKNLKDAFQVIDKSKVVCKTILLVDDIYTTGSTLNECARTLKLAGASRVIGLVLARASYKTDKLLN